MLVYYKWYPKGNSFHPLEVWFFCLCLPQYLLIDINWLYSLSREQDIAVDFRYQNGSQATKSEESGKPFSGSMYTLDSVGAGIDEWMTCQHCVLASNFMVLWLSRSNSFKPRFHDFKMTNSINRTGPNCMSPEAVKNIACVAQKSVIWARENPQMTCSNC